MVTAWPTAGLCLLIPNRRPRPDRRGRCCLEGLTRAKAAARPRVRAAARVIPSAVGRLLRAAALARSEEHTSELQSLMRISYAVFCLKKKKQHNKHKSTISC